MDHKIFSCQNSLKNVSLMFKFYNLSKRSCVYKHAIYTPQHSLGLRSKTKINGERNL